MVVFTCQHCGDPVKKPAVEKHYYTKCRYNRPHLTCVDCLKDFGSEDYGNHNQCMTEAERYSAEGTVFKEQKGKKKQEMYVEMIQKVLNSKDLSLSAVQRKLLEVCSNFDNVPRKLKPFKNFLNNVARGTSFKENDIDSVFNIIENAWKKETQPVTSSPEKEREHQAKETTDLQDTTMSNIKVQNKTNEEVTDNITKPDSSKKIKKNKNSENSLISKNVISNEAQKRILTDSKEKFTHDQNNLKQKKFKKKIKNGGLNMDDVDEGNKESLDEIINEGTDVTNKESKDAKKEKHERKSVCSDNGDAGNPKLDESSTKENYTEETITTVSKKQLKKQKKYEKYLRELENEAQLKVEENVLNGEDEERNDIKKIRKKHKKLKTNEKESAFHELAEDQNDSNKNPMNSDNKITKKRKLEECAGETPDKKIKGNSEEGLDASTVAVFSWGDVIMKVLSSQPDKELSLKKLGKKVVREYQAVKQDHRTYEELLVKFNKKVNKIKGVRVLKDRAKLIV